MAPTRWIFPGRLRVEGERCREPHKGGNKERPARNQADHPSSLIAASACSSQKRMSISRYIEGVLEIWIEPGLVKELGPLQAVEAATERLVRQLGDRLEQRERHILAHHGGHLEQASLLQGEPVDARRQHRLHR